jgi:hypothetical protein
MCCDWWCCDVMCCDVLCCGCAPVLLSLFPVLLSLVMSSLSRVRVRVRTCVRVHVRDACARVHACRRAPVPRARDACRHARA